MHTQNLIYIQTTSLTLLPLERLILPYELNGQLGSNRAKESITCHLGASNDLDAIKAWLQEFNDSPNTQRAYRKEAERLLLWAVLERNKPLSSLTREDLTLYDTFLKDPQPRKRWCGHKTSRFNPNWRPFMGPLSPISRRMTILVINSLFDYLVKAGYLAGNPLSLIRRRYHTHRESRIDRFLEQEQWQAVIDTINEMPCKNEQDKRHHIRSQYLLALLYLLGPRVSEVANHSMNSFIRIRGRWWWRALGKGRKEALVPVNKDMLDALSNYRKFHNLSPLPKSDDTTPLVLNLKGTAGIGDNMIYRIIKGLFLRAALRLDQIDPYQAAILRRASTHWIRHTSITHQADAGISLRYLQRNARHSQLDTTSLYLHVEEADWHNSMEKHRLKK